jgi:phosphotransferase system enzyme I (PtsI)
MPSTIVGPAFREQGWSRSPRETSMISTADELKNLRQAFTDAKRWFRDLDEQVEEEQKAFHDAILFYLTILDDQDLWQAIVRRIERRQETSEEAIRKVFEDYRRKLKSGDPYFQSRVFDINDVENRLLAQLAGDGMAQADAQATPKQFILFVKELTISSFSRIPFESLLAVVADSGGYNSHAAIILNANQIPFLIIPDTFRHVSDGDDVLLDFRLGTIVFRPSSRQIAKSKTTNKEAFGAKPAWVKSPLKVGDDIQVSIFPAVNHLKEANDPHLRSCEGIGLYRSEFLLFDQTSFPTEDVQYETYLALSNAVGGNVVFIRLFDIEPDKTFSFVKTSAYGAAYLVQNEPVLLAQLRALLRLSTHRPVAITIPMVQTQDEIDFIQTRIDRMMDEFRKQDPDVHFDVRLGAMIETVAMTHVIRKLKHLDYLQVGTNDLLASLLEVSRDSTAFSFDLFFDPLFLRMLKRIAADADALKLPIAICGEAANQPQLVPLLIALNYRRFVPSPTFVETAYGSIDPKRIVQLSTALPTLLASESLAQVQKKMRFL